MKIVEKMAKEFATTETYTDSRFTASNAFEAGFRTAREMILNDKRYDRTNWIEIPKAELAVYGEEEA